MAHSVLNGHDMRADSDAPQTVHLSSARRRRLTVYLPLELLDRVRNAVYWSPTLTLNGLIGLALMEYLNLLEILHGEPFPARLHELKPGRPRALNPRKKRVSNKIRRRIQIDNVASQL